ncbi:MAG: DUF2087 domain-containing protein [Candidatus Zixiibacteriota bacterium]
MDYYKGFIKNTEFFSTTELAEKLKMNVQVITRKIQSGEIHAYKIGKDWRIPEQSVFEWLQKHSNKYSKTARQKSVSNNINNEDKKKLPALGGKRKYFLEYILAQFEPSRVYTESEIDKIISRFHVDFNSVRTEFIAEKMMTRVDGKYRRCTKYRLSD